MHTSLTFAERQAAEAAYQGRPLDPLWPGHAQQIYHGIWRAKHGMESIPSFPNSKDTSKPPSTHFSQASAFAHKPLQVWLITCANHARILLIVPHHADTNFALHLAKTVAYGQPFVMQPIQHGHFHIQWPAGTTFPTLYSHDIRVMDQDGMVQIPSRLPHRPPNTTDTAKLPNP